MAKAVSAPFIVPGKEAKMSKQVKRTIGIMILCEFLICLGLSLIFPVEPFIQKEYHLTAFDMGLMTALFAMVQFVASPLVGRVSDQWGRKPMLVWGLVAFAVAEFIFAIGNHLWQFNLSRAINGLSAAMFVPTSMALAADITTTEQRARVIGWLSAAFSGGLILGPGLGGLLAHFNYKFPFWVAAALGLVATAIAICWLPRDDDEVVKSQTKSPGAAVRRSTWHQVRQMLTPTLATLFLMIFVAAFGLAGFEAIYSLYVNQVHGFGLGAIAMVLTINGLISLLLQVFFFEGLVRWLSEIRLIRWSYLLSAVGTIVVIYDHSFWQLVLATLVVFEGFDLLRPAITTLLTKMSAQNQGLLNGLNMSLTSVGNIVGPLLAGWLLDVNYQYPYWLVAGFLFVSWGIALVLSRRLKGAN